MTYQAKSIRTFIGAKDYQESITFYSALGFEAVEIGKDMTLFRANPQISFYLQDYYVKDWVDNSMIFLEVDDLLKFEVSLLAKRLDKKFKNVRISKIKYLDWGRELFVHDPSGILWHFGEFKN